MMGPEEIEFARSLTALSGWKWLPGMRIFYPDGTWSQHLCELDVSLLPSGLKEEINDGVPDLDDPATVGCLISMLERPKSLPVSWVCDWHSGVSLGLAVAAALRAQGEVKL